MNSDELSKRYLEKYEALILDFKKEHIEDLVGELNISIKKSDMKKTNILYSEIMNWNTRVSNLSGARLALNTQFSHLHLPSPSLYSVILDGDDRTWKFNTSTN